MTIETQLPFHKDPGFAQVLQDIQAERWQEGLAKVDALMEKYPFEPEIRNFRQQILVKSKIDEYEIEEIDAGRKKVLRKRLIQVGFLALFIFVIWLGSTTYANVIQDIVDRNVAVITGNFGDIELSIKFRNGQNLLQAGRAEEALVIFEEIKDSNADFENIDDFIRQAQGILSIDEQYIEAQALLAQDQWADALQVLQEIEKEDSSYKNVSILIDQTKRNINLLNLLSEANLSFDTENWAEAVIRFEAIRLSDPSFEPILVEERLFTSYISAAEAVIEDVEADEKELALAEGYFKRALALRPQDESANRIRNRVQDTIRGRLVDRYIAEVQSALVNQEDSVSALKTASAYLNRARELDPGNSQIALQSELANRFLSALDSFKALNWNQVISNLEYVYSFESEYASGTARQTLYDSYILRGDTYLASGDFELSLSDFRRAIELAQDIGETGSLSVYEAQLKVAFTLGLLLDYEGSVLMYQSAVNTGDLRTLLGSTDPAFIASINEANSFALSGSYRLAYIRYRDLFEQNDLVYSEFITHVVQEGDYLSQIARLYKSSIQAIVKANDISDPNRIVKGDELIIPIFSGE